MQREKQEIDFQPNYLVPMTKLKTSELRSIWKDDLSFRQYVRKFWQFSQKAFVESLVEDLIDEGAIVDYDFTGCVPGMDGVIYFKVDPSLESVEGFINGISKIQKNYGLFTDVSDFMEDLFDDDDEIPSSFTKKIGARKLPQALVYNELKKAWKAFKKNKQSQLEPNLFKLVLEQLEKMEQLFKSFVCASFDWIADDAKQLDLLDDFIAQYKGTLWYDMMNKRFMEVVDISKKMI